VRYPVDERFANAFVREFYRLLLDKGQPVPAAVRLAIGNIESSDDNGDALLAISPAVYGARAMDLVLAPPEDRAALDAGFDLAAVDKMSGFDRPPEDWPPRVQPLVWAREALATESQWRGVVFHGPTRCGKTLSALELAHQHADEFSKLAFHRVAPGDPDGDYAITQFAQALDAQLGWRMSSGDDPFEHLQAAQGMLGKYRELIVLDGLDAVLTERGRWRSQQWERLVKGLLSHDGPSRLVITCRAMPSGLKDLVRRVKLGAD
jgi:hypothetical protein